MNHIQLHPKRDRRLATGHKWIFSNEIAEIKGQPEAGEVVQVRRTDGHHIGYAYYHPHSLIAGRILTYERVVPEAAFYSDRIRTALELRTRRYPDANSYRLVHSEADGLPGLVIDRFNAAVVIQIVCTGAERHLDWIVAAIEEHLHPETILLKNDSGLRVLEGLPQYVKVIKGNEQPDPVDILEYDVTYRVNLLDGQKTGFYLDQRENRWNFRQFIRPGDRVLDAFCNDGGFALHAAKAGATDILAIDSSKPALERAKVNMELNGLSGIRFESHDLMEWLPKQADGVKYDVVNLDPPGFAKNKKMAGAALKGYYKLHEAALKVLKPGGILCTATCSHHIDADRFFDTLLMAASAQGREVQLLYRGGQPADHPVLPSMPETQYLDVFIIRTD
jgi:23S rRNA (cytosine1962-C5)-methyltransferase